MFTIEHGFDATVITLVDEGPAPLREDVTVAVAAEGVRLSQADPDRGAVVEMVLSHLQLRELAAALNLPEGLYRLDGRTVRRQDPG